MSAEAFGAFLATVLFQLVQYVVAAVFWFKPLQPYARTGFAIGAALGLFVAFFFSIGSGGAIPWVAWVIVTAFMAWRAKIHPKQLILDIGPPVIKLAMGIALFLFIFYAMFAIISNGAEAASGETALFLAPAYLSRIAIVDLLVVCASLGIYLDASKHKIGPTPGADGLLTLSSTAMASFALFYAPLAMTLYLVNRRSLIARAKEHPSEKKNLWLYWFFVVLFIVLSPIWLAMMLIRS